MPQTVEERFKTVNIGKMLRDFLSEFNDRRKVFTKNELKILNRLETTLLLFQKRLETITPANTPIVVINNAESYIGQCLDRLNLIFNAENKENRDAYVYDLATIADGFLSLFPSMDVIQNAAPTLQKVQFALEESEKIKSEIEQQSKLAKEKIIEIENHQTNIGTIAEILATKVLVGDYHERAKTEKTEADSWTQRTWQIAVYGGIALILFSTIQFFVTFDERQYFQYLSSKLLIALTVGLLAKWTSKRAARHLAEESKYHRLAVNMATVREFISTLTDDQKNVVISTVAIKTFTDSSANELPTEYESLNFLDAVKGLLPKTDK